MNAFLIRELEYADIPQMAQILAEGFPRRSLAFWQDRLRGMELRQRAPGTPLFGYGLEDGGLQGVALTFGSLHGPTEARQTIVNISSWAVRSTQRGPAAKELYRHATSADGVTFSNLSAAPHTQKTIKEFGFTERTAGQIVGVGVAGARGARRRILPLSEAERAGLAPLRAEMMRDHQTRGCLTFCIEEIDRLAPIMLLPRRVGLGIPVAQLIYCERLSDFVANSWAITLEILKRGFVALLIDASGPIEGLRGRYFPDRAAKYYKGPAPPYAVDHSYSEMIYIGL
ncbi:hypothetical protein [Bradyrhizobium sp.]|uniref:hypothetical protein n=1 Tax=Bradyrhizobium sp. TaxID=376 RepID=UPI003C732211